MSDSGQRDSWFIGEDGSLSIDEHIEDVVFHPSLNVILVTTKSKTVHVLDVASGAVFHSSDLSVDQGSSIRCAYLAGLDRVVFTSDWAVGARRDLNGMLLLESVLQLPVTKQDDVLCVELPLPEAIHLNQSLLGADLPGVDHVMDVMRLLDKEICAAQEAAKHNHKLAKWSTVCLRMPHAVLKSVFNGLLTELKRLQQKVPAVPVVSALLDRLSYLLVSGQPDSASTVNGVSGGAADRTLMYSESARLDTFAKWPHLNYKWALPEPMAQAGFYYQPSSTGDDRAMCFTCNVCLVCWEPTDEPWSEHERHSPQCPFVKGEFTQNVPVSVTYATEPAQRHCDQSQKIECVGTSTSLQFFATSTSKGNIVVWNTSRQLKKHLKFAVDLHDPVISSAIGNVDSKSAAVVVQSIHIQDQASTGCTASNQVNSSSSGAASTSSDSSELQAPCNGEMPVTDARTDISTFVVTALSVIVGSQSDQGVSPVFKALPSTSDARHSLIVGVFMQVDATGSGCSSLPSSLPTWKSDRSEFSEVQVLNQLNQAISGDTAPVICSTSAIADQNGFATSSENSGVPPQQCIPCLVLYDILETGQPDGSERETKNDLATFPGTQVTKMEMNDGSLSPAVYSMKDADMSDDDQDIQIIGVSGPASPSVPKIINLTNESIQGSSSYGIIGGPPYGIIGSKYVQPKDIKAKETEICDSFCQNKSLDVARNVVQCFPLPPEFVDSTQFVRFVIPVLDNSHVIVVTSPVSLREDMHVFSGDTSASPEECRSCVLIYPILVGSVATVLNPVPVAVLPLTGLDNAFVAATLLPQDVCSLNDDDYEEFDVLLGGQTEGLQGAVALTSHSGDIKILSLNDLSVLAVIKATSEEAYISTTYCTSIDRLCACTRDGKLRFFIVGPKQRHLDELDGGSLSLGGFLVDETDSIHCDFVLGDDNKPSSKQNSLLVNEPLTVEILTTLHDLIQFENLLPRFSATAPPCWNEIQQEQQQRKHPQHLHQQGEATQHTRTWRLQTDSTSWDEHLFELVLPRHICIGHIDLKFSLNSICTLVPNIQVTLLKQSLSSMGRSVLISDSASKASSVDADAKIDFSLPTSFGSEVGSGSGAASLEEDSSGGNDLGCEFLERHRSDIVCGPLELANYVDLSGTQGIIPLTGIQLLKCRSKSLLLHIKSRAPRDTMPVKPSQGPSKNTEANKSKPATSLGKTLSSMSGQGSLDRTTIGIGVNKQKVENMKGCDWLQELSVTVRRFRKAGHHHEGPMRCAMLQSVDFHTRLLLAACGQDDISPVDGSSSKEHRQHLALDILTWIMAIQMSDANKMQSKGSGLIQTLQTNLLAIVQSCLLEGDRSIAHKCAKLISLGLEYVKNCTDLDVAPAFNYALLQALLDRLPRTLTSYSAGALHWYFTLLNHVKCMDAGAAGEKCMELLGEIAKSYSSRVNPYHSILRARYGLYGMPLEPDLFDIDPPPLRTSPVTNNTYAGVVTNTVGATTGGISASGIPLNAGAGVIGMGANSGMSGNLGFSDDYIFKDLMNLCHLEKGVSGNSTCLGIASGSRDGGDLPLSRYLTGLLEVEPLHFTCHSTSDGTRMERMDALNQANTLPGNPVSLSGTINFAEGLSSATGTMLSSLSNAMVSAEQQLIHLQQKQLQLIKLQQQKQKLEQKLAETTKNVAGVSTLVSLPTHFFPYGSELFPPTPKNTPFFMTPPVTPPNESYHGILVGGGPATGFSNDKDADKPPSGKGTNSSKTPSEKNDPNKQLSMLWPQTQTLFQPPPAQALVIERMHSGARRFVVLDFGKAILLTDVVVPMCGDLASLSIDIWDQGEETDGHRLVVSSDIGVSSLIMNDIMPPPVCRYLKITTIRRYGGNSTRSKIPIGSFYGHTFMLPWEKVSMTTHSTPLRSNASPGPSVEHERMSGQSNYDQSQILSQLSVYMSLLEDVQCRYSLACKNLITLLSAADVPGNESNNTQFFIKMGRRTDDDNKIHVAYCECIQLQVQLNLVKHASSRLQKVLGIYNYPSVSFDLTQSNLQLLLKQTCVDKLRVLIEFLLDTLLSMTNSCPTIPQLPISLYMALTPSYAEMLFRNLCIHGTKKMQTHAGVILVRVCGMQSWWGEFLGNVLQEFFTTEQQTIFPQDRVFILLAALGQKSLTGPAASSILENILLLLARQLYPLTNNSNQPWNNSLRVLDLTLIGWLLLFLSKCLDCCQPNAADDIDKSSGKDKEGRMCFPGSVSNRWNFIQGENAVQTNKLSKTSGSKLYRRKLQKRLLHSKPQLINLQQAKKHFSTKMEESIATGNLLDKEMEHLVKTQDLLFKRQMRQYSSKHLKDIINVRRIDGEFPRKQNPKEGSGSHGGGEKDSWDCDSDSSLLVMSREKCIPVVHGLVMLLLSMDFTCHVDLFIVACKVLARVIISTRPTISLFEAMSQDDLERLMLLMCNIEYNHGNVSWGGSWASHSITCLLKDILEGERLYAMNSQLDTSVDNEMQLPPTDSTAASAETSATETEDLSLCNGSLSVMDDDQPANDSSAKTKYDVDMSMLVDALMEDELYDDQMSAKFTGLKDLLYSDAMKFMNVTMKSNPNSSTVHWGISGNPVFSEEDKKDLKLLKLKSSSFSHHTNTAPQGVSLAMDSRLEQGVEMRAELRLKLMLSMEANNIQSAMNSPLPLLTFGVIPKVPQASSSLPDEWLLDDGFGNAPAHAESSSSLTMLSTCFNNLFSQLHLRRINLDVLLQTWLTLNDDSSSEDNGCPTFDSCRIPTMTSDTNAISSLLAALAWPSSVSSRTWILAFETLTLMANIRYSTDKGVAVGGPTEPAGVGAQFPEKWLASFIITDSNLMNVLIKFLSGSGQQTSVMPIVQNNHIGPVVVLSFHEFLARLLRRCGDEDSQRLKEVLLRLVLLLSADGGAFHLFLGPLDAQYRFVEDLCELNLEMVDVNTAMSILESISALVHRHIMGQEHVQCRSTIENSVNARSVYVGLFSSMLRSSENRLLAGDATRDLLMCSLLKLASLLVKIPLPERQASKKFSVVNNANAEGDLTVDIRALSQASQEGININSSQTDFSKMNQAVGTSGSVATTLPEDGATDEEKTETAWSMTSTAATSSGGVSSALPGRKLRKCSHFVYSGAAEIPDPKPATLADIVLGHRQIMLHLMEALGSCNTNTVAMIFASSGLHGGFKQETAIGDNPLSVGDGIFNILLTLNSLTSKLSNVVKPIYEYLSSELQGFGSSARVSRLSEPLLWFVLRVLDCHGSISSFLEMGGIEVMCQNLVSTNRHIIDTSPSLVSAIMQYFGTAKLSNGNSRRGLGGAESADALQNFAPLGTITSSSPTANSADVLIHGTAPHRRARSAAWTYHYYPHEAWVDLNISLPCAILLKEVNIQPHLTSLATCPAAVTVEGSRDGTHTVPICPPTCTSGLTNIRIQLLKEEVVTVVTIRLHKPRDSHTVGLAQITLMGHMAFGDTGMARAANILTPPEDYVSRTSIGWLRLLHHCVTQCDDLQKEVTEAAVSTPDLLLTCTTLLMTSSALIYANSIESVLLTIGLHSTEMGLALLDQLLRNSSFSGIDDGQSSSLFYNKLNRRANESTIDILYQLGTHQDAGLVVRLKALTDWLGDCALLAIQKSHSASDDILYRQGVHHPTPVSLASPAVIHVHCIAAVLWFNNERLVTENLKRIVTKDLLSAMYEWSATLVSDSLLKQAVDSVICSLCFIHPHFFSHLLEWMGIIVYSGMESFTDDHKDIQHHLGPLTDDLKADTEAARGITESRMSDLDFPPCILQDINHTALEELHLFTLARACQSPAALRQLLNSGFVLALCQGLYEVSNREMRQHDEPMIILSDVSTDAVKMAMDGGLNVNSHGSTKPRMFVNMQGSLSDISSQSSASGVVMTADAVAPVLRFFAELSNEVMMKDWLGDSEGRIFWSALLKSLCASSSYVLVRPSHRAMTNEQRSAIETAAIFFFSKVISCHAQNQLQFSLVLHDVIQSYDSGSRGCPTPLPGFLRRIFLQVLLEDEKVLVCVSSHSQMYKGSHSGLSLAIRHPRFGVGHRHRSLIVSLQATCAEILSKISEAQSLVSSQVLEDQEKVAEEMRTDASDLGLKVKEKREKDALSSMQRPSLRPGGRNGDRSAASAQIPVLALYHSLLSDQPLPSELNMSQLLTVLYEHGIAPGQTYINLTMKLSSPHKDGTAYEKTAGQSGLEAIPEEVIQEEFESTVPNAVLLQAQNFTSALHVFSSVNGLALLAEHLPLLYPEFSRQATPTEVSKETTIAGGIGHDWVTVESAEDIYEEIYEPTMPPSPPVQHKPASLASTQVQSIPPHSLVAFGLFLRLPGYAEVLLKDKRKAQCLLRLVLGVTDDGEGGHILTSAIASSLPSLPFNVLKSLFDSMPLTTDDGVMLRRMTLEIGAIHLILACLSVLGHHAPRQQIPGFYQDIIKAAMQATQSVSTTTTQQKNTTEEKSQNYWAKGTGFGTGSTTSSWDAEHALLRQKSEEEHVTCLLQVLASFINPGGIVVKPLIAAELVEESDSTRASTESSPLPSLLPELLGQSCLVPALSSYLRNDSVLDMACHVPLYRALLELLRAMAVCPLLVPLLLPLDKDDDSTVSVSSLLDKMKQCVDTYASRLKGNRMKSRSPPKSDDDESEGLALLIPDIQKTAQIVNSAAEKVSKKLDPDASNRRNCEPSLALIGRMNHSEEERYIAVIKQLQFDTFKMVNDDNNMVQFIVPHHYESNVKASGDINNASRARRLAQEAVTLSTSLPLSASSSVFVRCDEERLDVMKVMMTGPADTPYANGCFEFDVYFPTDYPNSPPLINLETTGNHTIRFNPNLYNDGKVCLSILNTWHGRPEEKWNSLTSSFLQVLVSVQSLILVSEPYFNEPGYERSRGTPSGTASSREYDANIRQATVKWAMLEMLRNPPACFKSVIQLHFLLKRNEILSQIEEWISDLDSYSNDKRVGRSIAHSSASLKRHYSQLKEELSKLKPPSDPAFPSEMTTPSEGRNGALLASSENEVISLQTTLSGNT